MFGSMTVHFSSKIDFMRTLLVLALLVISGPNIEAEDWLRWRGPDENGSSATANPPLEWSLTKNIRWKI